MRPFALVCLGLTAAGFLGSQAATPQPAAAHRGPFVKQLVLHGEVTSANPDTYYVPRTDDWRIGLKWLVEEGAQVKAGDPIARFDTATLDSQIETAKLELEDKLQQRALKAAEAEQHRLEDRIQYERARVTLAKAKIDAAVPEQVRGPREYQNLQLKLAQAQRAFADAEASGATTVKKGQADLAQRDLDIATVRDKLQRLVDQLAALTVVARQGGIVVYGENWNEDRKVRVGDVVRSGMPLVRIPDPTQLEISTNASEVDVAQVVAGQPVAVRLDAWPDRVFHGHVKFVARAGESWDEMSRLNPFSVRIALDDADPSVMRPGMSAQCRITVQAVADALLVPLERVRLESGRVLVRDDDGRDREVTALGINEFYLATAPDPAGKESPTHDATR